MARKFLYFIAALVVLAIAGLVILRVWSNELSSFVFVPDVPFEDPAPLNASAYDDPGMWFSRPGKPGDNLARWQPDPSVQDRAMLPQQAEQPAPTTPPFTVFFIHPTSYFETSGWNDPLDQAESQSVAKTLIRGLASPFAHASEIWSPRYRQAAIGAFLTDKPEAAKAIDLAYRDVEDAFAVFVAHAPADQSIVLAGHSQGSLHLLRLYREQVAGTPLAARIAAVYAVGWPVSLEHDLPAMGIQPCTAPNQSGCLASWLSFSDPADPGMLLTRYRATRGFDGQPRGDGAVLCFNPLTGSTGGDAPASANLGTLIPNSDFTGAALEPRRVSARCDGRGLLIISDPPDLSRYVFPGNNYHVFDIPLFWRNLQLDAENRVRAWSDKR